MFCLNYQKHHTVSLITICWSKPHFRKWNSNESHWKGRRGFCQLRYVGQSKWRLSDLAHKSSSYIKQSIELSWTCTIQRWKSVKLCRKRNKSKRERWISLFNNLNCIKAKVRLQRPRLKVTASYSLVLLVIFEIKYIQCIEVTGQSISI